ncbi:MAG: hypothetical protein HY650_13635 [Acidobacteria bacterium]|nr:hypothetical protein [Acidobacteriota bacterium]
MATWLKGSGEMMGSKEGKKLYVPGLKMKDLPAIKYTIEQFLSGAPSWRVRLNDAWLADLPRDQFATSIEFGKLIFALWTEERSESWRVAGCEPRSVGLRLMLTRRMGGERFRLDLGTTGIRPGDFDGLAELRETHLERIVAALRARFSPMALVSSGVGRSHVSGLSSIYTRVAFRAAGRRLAAVSIGENEADESIHGILTAAIIWTHQLAGSSLPPERCLIIVPEKRSSIIARRMTALSAETRTRLEIFELQPQDNILRPIQPADQGLLFDPVAIRLARARPELRPSRSIPVPGRLPTGMRAISHPDTGALRLTCHGLEVAEVTARGTRINRAVAKAAGLRRGSGLHQLGARVAQIRRAESDQRWHPLFRWQAERWLEELIREDPVRIDPQLNPKYLYPQVPAHGASGKGRIDLLGIRHDGRLAILELKVTEDLELPMQGLDYWLRVEWHRKRGDFHRRGYFADASVSSLPAVLYLVAPVFRFHREFEVVSRAIDPEVPVYRISLNEDWRSGVKVLKRDRLNVTPHFSGPGDETLPRHAQRRPRH